MLMLLTHSNAELNNKDGQWPEGHCLDHIHAFLYLANGEDSYDMQHSFDANSFDSNVIKVILICDSLRSMS